MKDRLLTLYQQLSELTQPICAKECRVPQSCCSPEYCDMAEARALEHGVVLRPTEHPTLKFMGTNGCVVAPHWRPLCTFHLCSVNSFGFIPGDPARTAQYFKIRDEIENEEYLAYLQIMRESDQRDPTGG